jgi:hypothetical protein
VPHGPIGARCRAGSPPAYGVACHGRSSDCRNKASQSHSRFLKTVEGVGSGLHRSRSPRGSHCHHVRKDAYDRNGPPT